MKLSKKPSVKAENRKWVEEYKRTRACAFCGEDHIAVLEFHHSDPKTKKYTISQLLQKETPLEDIQEEISKTMLLCSNCHKILHWELNGRKACERS